MPKAESTTTTQWRQADAATRTDIRKIVGDLGQVSDLLPVIARMIEDYGPKSFEDGPTFHAIGRLVLAVHDDLQAASEALDRIWSESADLPMPREGAANG